MSLNNPAQDGAQPIPVIACVNREATDWYEVYSALCRHAIADTQTARLPENAQARALAFARFNAAFEVL